MMSSAGRQQRHPSEGEGMYHEPTEGIPMSVRTPAPTRKLSGGTHDTEEQHFTEDAIASALVCFWAMCGVATLFTVAVYGSLSYYDLDVWALVDSITDFEPFTPPRYRSGFFYSFGPALIAAGCGQVLFMLVVAHSHVLAKDVAPSSTWRSHVGSSACVILSVAAYAVVIGLGVSHLLYTLGTREPYMEEVRNQTMAALEYVSTYEFKANSRPKQRIIYMSPTNQELVSMSIPYIHDAGDLRGDYNTRQLDIMVCILRFLPFVTLFAIHAAGIVLSFSTVARMRLRKYQ